MPATSENQRKLFCIALSVKQGKTSASYSKAAADLAKNNDEGTLKDYCEAPVKKG